MKQESTGFVVVCTDRNIIYTNTFSRLRKQAIAKYGKVDYKYLIKYRLGRCVKAKQTIETL